MSERTDQPDHRSLFADLHGDPLDELTCRVLRASRRWAHLPANPFKVMIFMVLNGLGDSEPILYRGSWGDLARTIRPDMPSLDQFDTSAAADSARKAVRAGHSQARSAVRALIAADAAREPRPLASGSDPALWLFIDTTPGPECLLRDSVTGWIYYVRIGDWIKIGYAADLKQRLRAYPPDAELLASHPGTLADEAALHKRFKPHLAAGREWYPCAPEILEHVATL